MQISWTLLRRPPPPPSAPGLRLLGGEKVLLLSIALPRMTAAQRRAALAFAVEDQVARPLEELSVTLGPDMGGDRWLVAVVARADLPADLAPGERLVPDTLTLPVPPPGHWAVLEDQGRILLRLPDGTGLVTRPASFALLYAREGAPPIRLYGGSIAAPHEAHALPPPDLPPGFDLAPRRGLGLPRLGRQILAVAGLTALAHLAILGAQVLQLTREEAALVAQWQAATGTESDAAQILAQPAPQGLGPLELMASGFAAMTPGVEVQALDWTQGALTLTLQGPPEALDQAEADLALAGLAVSGTDGAEDQRRLTLQAAP